VTGVQRLESRRLSKTDVVRPGMSCQSFSLIAGDVEPPFFRSFLRSTESPLPRRVPFFPPVYKVEDDRKNEWFLVKKMPSDTLPPPSLFLGIRS